MVLTVVADVVAGPPGTKGVDIWSPVGLGVEKAVDGVVVMSLADSADAPALYGPRSPARGVATSGLGDSTPASATCAVDGSGVCGGADMVTPVALRFGLVCVEV